MEITKKDILTTINKMVAAGKELPQRSRIRFSKDPNEEQMKVIGETINVWWDIFSQQHIGVKTWAIATNRAMVLSGISGVDTITINPALMQAALNQCSKERLEELQNHYAQEKKDEKEKGFYPFPEMPKLLKYHQKNHLKPYLPLPDRKTIIAWAKKHGWNESIILFELNLIKLRLYYLFGEHAIRDKTEMPLRLVIGEDKKVTLEFTN